MSTLSNVWIPHSHKFFISLLRFVLIAMITSTFRTMIRGHAIKFMTMASTLIKSSACDGIVLIRGSRIGTEMFLRTVGGIYFSVLFPGTEGRVLTNMITACGEALSDCWLIQNWLLRDGGYPRQRCSVPRLRWQTTVCANPSAHSLL